jgi:hypothetical protein
MASIGASHQISVHFGKAVSEKKISKKSTNLKQELPVSNLYSGPSIDGRFCIKFPQSRMKGEQHRLSSVLSLLFILPCFVIFIFELRLCIF